MLPKQHLNNDYRFKNIRTAEKATFKIKKIKNKILIFVININ